MPELPLYQVDAFTNEPFKGNPAAVCLLKKARPEEWMRALAAEMNLSETAFVLPQGEEFNLHWFTPTTEMDLCGHATLASAHTLGSRRYFPGEEDPLPHPLGSAHHYKAARLDRDGFPGPLMVQCF